jgi:hypothetical protein
MLHRPSKEGLICITQPNHAWVSGELARAWGNEHFGEFVPPKEVCLAAEQHDIGWLLWEQAPTLNPKTGYPYRFTELPTQVHIDRFGQGTLLGVYRWLVLSLTAYLLAYWVHLASGSTESPNWFEAAQQALFFFFPQVLLLLLFDNFERLQPWLQQHGFELCLVRCKI